MDDDQYYDDGEPYDEGDDDEEIDDTALAEAMALNQQLRAALEMQALQDTQKMQQQQMYEMQQRHPAMGKSQGQPPRKAMAARNRDEWAGQHGESMGVQRSDRSGDGKKKGKANYTFDTVEMNQMGRENERLLGRMIDIKAGKRGPAGGGFSHNDAYERPKHMSSNAINRRRKDDKIARENQKIANRLRSVASTSGRSSGGGGGGGGGARSSGYGAVEPWRRPQKNAALKQKKTLVQPAWNDRP